MCGSQLLRVKRSEGSEPAEVHGDERVGRLGHILEMEPSGFTDGLSVWSKDMVKSNMSPIDSPEHPAVPKSMFV